MSHTSNFKCFYKQRTPKSFHDLWKATGNCKIETSVQHSQNIYKQEGPQTIYEKQQAIVK